MPNILNACLLPCCPAAHLQVMYECAVTLVSLSSAPTAVRAAANCFCQLLVSHSDNNVKLIVLDRLQVGTARLLPALMVVLPAVLCVAGQPQPHPSPCQKY